MQSGLGGGDGKVCGHREGRGSGGRNGEQRNWLIWGNNKLVMASLLAGFKGRIDLIYIDPPFDVGADFTNVHVGPNVADSAELLLGETSRPTPVPS